MDEDFFKPFLYYLIELERYSRECGNYQQWDGEFTT